MDEKVIEAATQEVFVEEQVRRGIPIEQANATRDYFWEHEHDFPQYDNPVRMTIDEYRHLSKTAIKAADAARAPDIIDLLDSYEHSCQQVGMFGHIAAYGSKADGERYHRALDEANDYRAKLLALFGITE